MKCKITLCFFSENERLIAVGHQLLSRAWWVSLAFYVVPEVPPGLVLKALSNDNLSLSDDDLSLHFTRTAEETAGSVR